MQKSFASFVSFCQIYLCFEVFCSTGHSPHGSLLPKIRATLSAAPNFLRLSVFCICLCILTPGLHRGLLFFGLER